MNSLEQIINQRMEAFLQVTRKSTNEKEVEARSLQLTASIKDPAFLAAAYQLLTNPNSFPHERKDKETLLTSLLKDKFKYEFETIEQNVQVHYQQLCEIAHHLQKTTYAAYTNISLALAYTYLHLLATHPCSLQTFLAPFLPSDPSKAKLYNYYFKTLQYIATEVDNNKFVIDEVQRQTSHDRLVAQQLTVLHSLNQIAPVVFSSDDLNKQHILLCFQAWVSVHYDPAVLNSLPSHILFAKALQHIQDEQCGQGASNSLRSIIYQLKDPEENKVIYEALSNYTLQILQLVQHSLKNMQVDKAEEFMRIIADFSRKSKRLFIQRYDSNIDAFMKKLINHMKDDIMNIYENLADFFEDFLDQIIKVKKQGLLNINPQIYNIFDPLYCALCYKCMIPIRIIKELNQTEESKAHHISSMAEQLFRDRQFTETIFESISELQGKTGYLQFVLSKMQSLNPADQRHFWSELQVYLFSLEEAAREYPAIDNNTVNVLKMYIQLAEKPDGIPICVRRSFLKLFKALTTSLEKNSQFIYRVMCAAVSCFEQPLLYSTAEKTFCRACEQNKNIAVQIFAEFGPVLEKYPQRDYIVKGLVTLMCTSQELTKQYLHQALSFLFGKFMEEIDKARRKEYMHSIVAALKAFKESPVMMQNMGILQQFMREIWPFTKQILASPQRIKDDEDSDVERVVRILKVIMRTLGYQFSQFLEDLFNTVLIAFQKHPICSYVYLVEVAVTVYSGNPSYIDYLKKLYSDFCEIAYEHMKKIEDIGRYSYFLDDFMGMNKRFFLYAASIVLSSGKLADIIEICINGFMGCDIPRVAKAAYSFFETIFIVYWRPEFIQARNSLEDVTPFIPKPEDSQHYLALKAFLLQKLEKIVGKMLEHLSTAPTQETRDYILDALVSQIKGFTQQNPTLWNNLLSKISSQILVQNEKERMIIMLQSLKTTDFQTTKKTVKAFDKMLVLMNRRMINADKRKNIVL